MGKYITPEGLAQLHQYHYKSGTSTTLDDLLSPYWNYVVTLVPLWVAPNVITFIGFIIFLSSNIIIFCYDLSLQKDIPSWCFYWAAISQWIYSTLDAIDGKQARRTQSSSALGQLFDHGCDSFSVSFLIIIIGAGGQL